MREQVQDRGMLTEETGSPRPAIAVSLAFHALALAAVFLALHYNGAPEFVAAGPGEGGEGGGGSIQVGVADASAILGFAKPQPVSFIGDKDSPVNNTRVETARPEPNPADVLMPPTDRETPRPDAVKTDRPVVNHEERIFTGKDERGRSDSQSAQVGRTFGSPTPALLGGVGIGHGGSGSGTGLPGGSEYGRRIQSILSRNYTPPQIDAGGVQYVIIVLRIARDGRILSVVNDRVSPAFIKQRSSNAQINFAAERAVIAANPLPPFPTGFLIGAPEAVAEVWFRYPK